MFIATLKISHYYFSGSQGSHIQDRRTYVDTLNLNTAKSNLHEVRLLYFYIKLELE